MWQIMLSLSRPSFLGQLGQKHEGVEICLLDPMLPVECVRPSRPIAGHRQSMCKNLEEHGVG